MIVFFPIGLIWLFCALPGMVRSKSAWGIFVALVVSLFGVVIPLLVFGFSIGATPDWKGASTGGWFGCWIYGKIALSPLVLYATFCLYSLENRFVPRSNPIVAHGIFIGAVVSSVCAIYGFATSPHLPEGPVILVPVYVAVWYVIRAFQTMRAAECRWFWYLVTLAGSIPFWLWSMFLARRTFDALPDTAPHGCFVVTAASRGHESLVGPFYEALHRGRLRRANQQLITLWRLESLWRVRSPRSHGWFRSIYNQHGPRLAARVRSRWVADLLWISFKPAEWLAALLLSRFSALTVNNRPTRTV